MKGDAIEARSLTKRFGAAADAVTALDRVSVTIRENEFFTLLGPSGCGKTTLLRLIAGFELPTEGELYLHGQRIESLPPFRRPVNTVFQSYALFPHLNVQRNVAFAPEMQNRPRSEINAEVRRTLDLVRLNGFEKRLPRELSGGQQQRVALARALAGKPKVLLLDEPLSALDLKLRREMQIELKRLQHETGITFVFVTHDQEEALTMSDRIAVMSGGRILQIGTPTEIYEQPTSRFVADFIGETNFLAARCLESIGGRALYRLPSGTELEGIAIPGLGAGSDVTLAVRPERVDLVREEGQGMPAIMRTILYVGNDTICTVALPDGTELQARVQNRRGAIGGIEPGSPLRVRIPPEAIRVVGD
ncbi:MAG TPA: ABC transporter ATP-binding protein [Geminicoccus sp.]|jgi:spermidine/putrescine transport system ATP-binding protein|uniref:ABC transporter ATP-binding protein n=1 Tax=Geminicoccus sp. TaxID=2024832 RepID=UPI002E30F718|nr:ABC transporter ATP-binding protein [Geminicoccus sp.]HEX2527854.1 ABC transporter ATP-binding protein [Geminicoccus sp.]